MLGLVATRQHNIYEIKVQGGVSARDGICKETERERRCAT